MEPFKKLRLGIGRFKLKRRLKGRSRTRYSGNFNTAKSIGIVWDASATDEFRHLSHFYQKMQERNIEVSIMGWYPDKILPDKLTAIRYLSIIKIENVDFFYCPSSSDSEEFIRKKFDILIDLNFENIFPLEYISSLSAAALKVGIFDSEKESQCFDLMMQMKKSTDKGEYLAQVIHYLELVKRAS
jgi:hypothetical protein